MNCKLNYYERKRNQIVRKYIFMKDNSQGVFTKVLPKGKVLSKKIVILNNTSIQLKLNWGVTFQHEQGGMTLD